VRSDGTVRAELARRRQERQGEQVCRDRHQRADRVRAIDERAVISGGAVGSRILNQGAEHAVRKFERELIAHLHRDAQRDGPGCEDVDGLGWQALEAKKTPPAGRPLIAKNIPSPRRRGAFIQQ